MLLDPARLAFSRYFDWYEDRLDSLFRVNGTLINGIGLLGQHNLQTRFNYLSAVSRFYQAAVLADLPLISPALHSTLHQVTEHWSVCGESFLIRSANGIRVVRPDYVFPIVDPYDRDRVERFLFVFPFRDTQQGDWSNELISSTFANVIDYDVASRQAFMSRREYSAGNVADGPIGTAVNIGEVIWIRSGGTLYPALESIVREVIVRLNMLQLALNTTAIPIIQVDKDSINDGGFRGQNVNLESFQKTIANPLGMTVLPPFGGEEGARFIERSGTGLNEAVAYVQLLLGQLGVISGVPDYVFGISIERPTQKVERVLFSGQARVNSYRRALEEAINTTGQRIRFSSEPFVTRAERLNSILAQVNSGIITTNEAREQLGYEPLAGPPPVPPAQRSNQDPQPPTTV